MPFVELPPVVDVGGELRLSVLRAAEIREACALPVERVDLREPAQARPPESSALFRCRSRHPAAVVEMGRRGSVDALHHVEAAFQDLGIVFHPEDLRHRHVAPPSQCALDATFGREVRGWEQRVLQPFSAQHPRASLARPRASAGHFDEEEIAGEAATLGFAMDDRNGRIGTYSVSKPRLDTGQEIRLGPRVPLARCHHLGRRLRLHSGTAPGVTSRCQRSGDGAATRTASRTRSRSAALRATARTAR